ncbi:MAG: HAD-IB family hydrolase [Actinobacteria bacterium]|nr:MAG: HAD-IB family hydrolase [Actinomycetota bacterium]
MDAWALPLSGQSGTVGAAFFDLDKTILATSSSVALRSPLVHAGLMTRRGAALAVLIHLPYLLRGTDRAGLERLQHALGSLAKGWDACLLESTVRDALRTAIDPVCFLEALDQITLHRAAGQPVVIASASIKEVVRPIGDMLGADHCIGSDAEKDEDGAFTGELLTFNYAEEKARACEKLAERRGWDMSRSYAYSDSVTDIPLLEAVGHPVAVNPDKGLREVAEERGWQILSFSHTARVRSTAEKVAFPIAVGALGLTLAAVGTWALFRIHTRKKPH